MINFNGQIVAENTNLSNTNRGFLYGDGIFETLKIVNNKILYLEDHYFRLMASMRIVRMQIPSHFTLEFMEQEILNLANELNVSDSARIRFTVFRNDGGYYLPLTKTVSYIIHCYPLENKKYHIADTDYEVDLYKDFFIAKQLLSTLKTTNKMIHITGSIFANENDLQNCLLINNEKNVIEAVNGNLFMIVHNKIITPPISDGCLNGIMRKQILEIAKKMEGYEVVEETISPFDLQKAEELFITNVIAGIVPITKYRKKEYQAAIAKELLKKLNIAVFI